MTFEEFAAQYRATFETWMSYTPDQVGSELYGDRMAALSDLYPAWAAQVEEDAYLEHQASRTTDRGGE